ncbi:MAG TPA: DUF5947 family protein [Candidatus Binatia bacterium]|nr:DUF5947 family protein [Candidatus Binatia bacterium]
MTPGPDRPLSRLRRLAAPRPVPRPAPGERCDLCAAPIPDVHRHLADVHRRALACACGACAILFDGRTAGPARYRLVPERRRELVGVALDDAAWDALGVPVATAFFFHATAADRVVACYPSPGGAIESLPPGDAWSAVVAANPVLAAMAPDVEAFLVHRARGAREHWIVPIDACYRLVAVVRAHWKGFGGGSAVWAEIARFFEGLRRGAERTGRDGRAPAAPREDAWQQ